MVSIRRATQRDFPDILRIQREAFSEYLKVYEVSPWLKETLENVKLDATDKIVLVAQEEGLVVGSVRFWTVAGVCVIRLLAVCPARQGRGVGNARMQEAGRLASDAHNFYVCTMLRTPRNIGL